jgi:hypothetical protein
MSDTPYSKRETDMHFSEIKDTLREIKDQTIKTNGRVTSLEKWRWTVTGGLIVVGGIGAANISLLAKLFSGL